jgi:CheY-like chemotaxis protein
MNLCINAVDAMPEGGTLTIATRNLSAAKVQLEVKDTGAGMTPEILEKATDPFFSTKPQGKGTGLGLPMVYSAAEAHAAQFEIASQPGRGTRVRLTFPTVDAPFDDAPESGNASWTPSGLSILAVDDDWIVLRGLARQLARLGHHVTPCTKGTDALSHLEKPGVFDLVVLDVNMPDLGGCALFACSRQAGHDYPVLFVTGRPDEALQQFVVDHPGTAMLAKPFTQGELQTAIRRVCGGGLGWSLTPPSPSVRRRSTPRLDAGE